MKYKKRRYWKYQLYETVTYDTGIILPEIRTEFINLINGILTVRKGYTWDGASGPTFDTKNTFTASLIHDALYQLMRENWIDRSWRKRSDQILYEILRSRKMFKWRAKLWYRAVRQGAAHSTNYDVLIAP